MTVPRPTVQDLEDFHEKLQGPLGEMLRAMGEVMNRRLRERGSTWQDLSDPEMIHLFHAAMLEAAPPFYPGVDPDTFTVNVDVMFRTMAMLMAANASGSDAQN